jgi:hypothetical protein
MACAAFFLFFTPRLFGAPERPGVPGAGSGQPVRGVPGRADVKSVVNFGDLPAADAVSPGVEEERTVPDFMPMPRRGGVPPEAAGRWQEDTPSPGPQISSDVASNGTPAPTASFAALGDNNTRIPPDVHGAAGPNHLMTTLNTQVRIQNRAGSIISTVLLSSFWSPTGASVPFDPKVLYDPYAKRWMFTAVSNAQSSASSVLMGVSQDSNPTGTWNLYRMDADPTNRVWADYPSMGFNKNWIVVNVNLFTVVGDTFIRSDNYAFNKADLYAGGSGLFTRLEDNTGGGAITPALTYDTTVSTMYMLEDWIGNFGGVGRLRLSTITGSVGAEVYTPGVAFPSTTDRWEDLPSVGFADFAPQLGSSRLIMCNDARMQNTVYRNGFLWCTHSVFLPAGSSTRSSVQWWKITPAGAVSQRGRMDDASGTLFYAFPSIAVNKNDAVLLGYSRFSANQYASGNYAYRVSTDPANTLRNDTVLKAGEATYDKDFGFGANRWGDYTNTVVDPVNDVGMWTIQQYAETPFGGFDRWGTWWGQIPDPSDPCAADTVNPTISCSDLVQGNDPGQCMAVVSFSPTVSDNCPGAALACTPSSGSAFPVGVTGITCIATDAAGNADTCQFSVTVNDTTKPATACPANVVVFRSPAECDSVTAAFTANASDNCPGVLVVCLPPSGSKFPLGNSSVTCTATDGAGNQDSCGFTVTVHKGDLNGDGNFTASDVILILNCAFLGTGICPLCALDLNCDTQLTAGDVVTAVNAAFLGNFVFCTP